MAIQIGDSASLSRTFTQQNIDDFARLSGDKNPLHLNASFAKDAMFGAPIVHGFLVGSLISAVLGEQLPGPGTVYLSQNLQFRKPVFPGDEITASVEITDLRESKGIYTLSTQCHNQSGELVLEGEAVVLLPQT